MLDLTKAFDFDTVNGPALWKLLPKLGCPAKICEQLHGGIRGSVSAMGLSLLSIPVVCRQLSSFGMVQQPSAMCEKQHVSQ